MGGTVKQAATRCTTTEGGDLDANDSRQHLIIQNASGGVIYITFDGAFNGATPTAANCSLEIVDSEFIQIPNFTGSVKSSITSNVAADKLVRYLEFA